MYEFIDILDKPLVLLSKISINEGSVSTEWERAVQCQYIEKY